MTIALKHIISVLSEPKISGTNNFDIDTIVFDSRKANKNSLFFAVKGTQTDGHLYINQVIDKGCKAIVCEEFPNEINDDTTYIKVKDSSVALAQAAGLFYNYPSKKLKLVGVTGTNGKTTITTLLFNLFTSLGYKCGLLSTVQNQIGNKVLPSTHTTPDAVSINILLNDMVNEGCEFAFMEASSHAIHQNRIFGLHFAGVVFSNITHDHLDYHGTFENYIKAKKKLFDDVNADAFALTNKDDKNGMVMLQNTKATKYTYALNQLADFKAKIIESDFNGLLLNIDGSEAWYKLAGDYNAYNLLAVYATAFLLGQDKQEIITKLSNLNSVKGRYEYIKSKTGITAIIDYAHTPDALENILNSINKIRTKNEELITVVGCGGNRDAAKRPVMGDVSTKLSTKVIFTSDNPRNENPEEIIAEMQKGVAPLHYKKTLKITDRKEAIKAAVNMAKKGDIILIAGKGHENYQEINGVKYPFDDREVVTEMFNLLDK
ncbi:MAG: UDP-N-acetylmuramoyl-L-alanyl-D-glutamate--2,6-diaminopimelate ligase [Bacteroidia bacterium]